MRYDVNQSIYLSICLPIYQSVYRIAHIPGILSDGCVSGPRHKVLAGTSRLSDGCTVARDGGVGLCLCGVRDGCRTRNPHWGRLAVVDAAQKQYAVPFATQKSLERHASVAPGDKLAIAAMKHGCWGLGL